MRKLFMCVLLLAGTLTLQAQIKIGKMKIDTKKAIQAGKDAAGAITLSDKDIANMSQEYIQWMDTQKLFKFYSKIILWQRYASWLRAYRPCIHSQWSVS